MRQMGLCSFFEALDTGSYPVCSWFQDARRRYLGDKQWEIRAHSQEG
jgi:hypothetical protein